MSQEIEFDIVIPVHKKDLSILEYCISAAKKKIVGARRIIVVSKERYSTNAEWYDESKYPFSREEVKEYMGSMHLGWHYQQLLKMYAPLVIPDISENVMILDSDTVFFKKTKMFDNKNRPFYNLSKDTKICRRPFDISVDKHIQRVWPEISRDNIPEDLMDFSGISHNMIFNKSKMKELFEKVEEYHGNKKKFYEIILDLADKEEHSVSEYQMYFNFMTIFYRDEIAIRTLKYKNTADINIKKYQKRLKYHYCSFHSYLRQKRGSCYKVKLEKLIYSFFKKLFQIRQYNFGVIKNNISSVLTLPNQEINWLQAPKIDEFRFSPFGLKNGDQESIIFEKYNICSKKSEIHLMKIDENLQINSDKKIISEAGNFSYPYIFNDKDKNYCIVNNSLKKEVLLYEILSDLSLKKIKTIFENIDIKRPSIVKHNEKYWMFFSSSSKENENLNIAYCDDLIGDWKMHKNNPVTSDLSSTRSAGEIFIHENKLYRPTQDCSNVYGSSIKINETKLLNEDYFEENEHIEITPNQLGKYPKGVYNISSLGKDLTLVEGKREYFVIHKFFIYFCRIIIKIKNKIIG